jgi:RNA polymerase sigma-70 factor (ECF subfamily)
VRDEHAALDIVQDAMLKLAEKYSEKPAPELPLLFHRILQNTIRDYFRRHKVRSAWSTLLSNLFSSATETEIDPLDTLTVEENTSISKQPHLAIEQAQIVAQIEDALSNLSPRQREAFLLRYWEEFDTNETAQVMGCTEGSVKTHCSRAVDNLAQILRKKGVTL